MTVLTLTTGLTCVLGLLVGLLADGLTVSNLGCTHVCLNLELTQQTVNDDLQMFGYATDLRSKTQGRGQYVMEPSHYEPVPKNIADQIIAGRTKA